MHKFPMTYFVERDLPWTLQKMYLAQWKTYKIYYREYRQMLFKKLLENKEMTSTDLLNHVSTLISE